MLSEELLAQVKALDDDNKRRLFMVLLEDPALAHIAPEVTGLRYNGEAARILQEMLEEEKGKTQQEVK